MRVVRRPWSRAFGASRRSGRAAIIATALVTLGFATPASAQDQDGWDPAFAANSAAPPLALTRISGEIVLDGIPDEPAWQEAAPLPLTMYYPTHRGTPAQRTEMRVVYDDEFLYVAGWFYDDEPQGVRINSLYRDRWNGDDALAVYVDAFNDNENAKWFGITPAGVRFDLLVSDDGATLNGSWDGFWDAATRVTDEGWFGEVRIPFSTLGFQSDADGEAVMGLTLTRLVSRTGERVTFPDIDPAFEFRRPSVARDVILQDVESRNPVYATPYVLAGAEQSPELQNPSGAASPHFDTDTDTSRELGLDLRYSLGGNLTLDLTANTDFAQVEADEQQVNLDRFPLFFPEKRRFFQERSGLFEFTTGNGGRLFHSRRIGLTSGREPVPVLGGARLTGRLGSWDVGVLDMQTDDFGGTPSENFAVARLRRRVLNDFSTLGVMATARTGGVSDNVAVGVDGSFRLRGDDYLTLKWAGTESSDEAEGTGLAERSVFNARWQRRANRGLAYTLEYVRQGEAYDPAMGFVPRRDFTTANVLANYYIFTDEHGFFRRVWPGMLAFSTFRNSDGSLESGRYAVWVQWETKSGGRGWIEPKLFRDDVARVFTIGGEAEVPAGDYTYADLQFNLSMPTGRKLRTGLDLRVGTFFDGTRQQLTLRPTWNVSPHLELGGSWQFSRIRFDDRDQGTDVHLARLRVRTALDAHASGNIFVQYNSTTDRVDLNVRLRYNFAEGTDLWLVYNEGLDTERLHDVGSPRPPLSTGRSLIVKYTKTFGF